MWRLPTAENMLVALERNCSEKKFELIQSFIFLESLRKVPVHGKQTYHLEGHSNVLSANLMESKDDAANPP